MTYRQPEPLGPAHHIDDFVCRSVEQTQWLLHHARQSAAGRTTRVFVVTHRDTVSVVAYYAWRMASIELDNIPERLRKGAGRYPQPVPLLARLGVSRDLEGLGLGAGLLQDVMARTLAVSEAIGCRGLIIHAESQAARDFYRHLIPEIEPSPTDELHLVLLTKDIQKTLRGRDTQPTD